MINTPRHLGGHMDVTHIDQNSLEYLIDTYKPKSYLDVGCGPGGMVDLALKYNLTALGIDGDPKIDFPNLVRHDFTVGPIDDLGLPKPIIGWSCEFVEHVEQQFIPNYITAFRQCDIVVITHAPPGAPGYHHVNCQTSEYWIDIFNKNKFEYLEEQTGYIRKHSSMKRDFVRNTGLVFRKAVE
jgi:hypothetical protein